MKVRIFTVYCSGVAVLTSIAKGPTRFDRLYTIGRSSIPLCIEALKLAVREAKGGISVGRYIDAHRMLAAAAPNEPEATFDQDWVDKTRKRVEARTTQLEAELKGYKNNLVKESIRVRKVASGVIQYA